MPLVNNIWSSALRRLSRYKSPAIVPRTSEELLSGFRAAQRLAYRCVCDVEGELREGMTEREAAELLERYLRDHGVHVFLHRPFAWFGEHSRFDGYDKYTDFIPGQRRLKADEPFILDVAPMLDGYIGDIGYTSCLSPNEDLRRAREHLLELRAAIPELFASARSTGQIWAEVDRRVRDAGYDNRHARYPFAVLGHRVYRVRESRLDAPYLPLSVLSWFSLQGQLAFLRHGVFSEILTPEHDGEKLGLWAIEPHVGKAGFGAKFEEILVVDEDGARWLDDDVPHVTGC